MRIVLAALAALAAFASPAAAQDTPPSAAVEAPAAEHPTTAALRDFFLATFFETGIVDATIAHFQPIYRESISGWDIYRRANAQRRAAIDGIIDGIPQMMREELASEAATMAANTTVQVQAIVTPEEMASLVELMRLPLWRRHALTAVANVVANKGEDGGELELSDADLEQLAALENTPGAQALIRSGDQFWPILNTESEAAMVRLVPRLQLRLAREFCSVLGRECPRELRDQIEAT